MIHIFIIGGGMAGIAGMAAARKISPKAGGSITPAKGGAGAAGKIGAVTSKKKGSLVNRLSKMQKDASFGPSGTLGVR